MYANPSRDSGQQPELTGFLLLRCFWPYLALIMVRCSKFKISLEALNGLYWLIWASQKYANVFLRTCSGRPWVTRIPPNIARCFASLHMECLCLLQSVKHVIQLGTRLLWGISKMNRKRTLKKLLNWQNNAKRPQVTLYVKLCLPNISIKPCICHVTCGLYTKEC